MDPRWISPKRETKKSNRIVRKDNLLLKQGKRYEQKIYKLLQNYPHTVKKVSSKGDVSPTDFTPQLLDNLHQKLLKNPQRSIFLLEHQYPAPQSFKDYIFPPRVSIGKPNVEFGGERPDIMIIGNNLHSLDSAHKLPLELKSDGSVRELSSHELSNRFGITIIDIKHTAEENVGKKHFIEILYYIWVLAFWLVENKLDYKFYVRLDSNGIFPTLPKDFSSRSSPEFLIYQDFISYLVPVRWKESHRLFTKVFSSLQDMWAQIPCEIEKIPLNLQPTCGYCEFLEDCTMTLGMKEGVPRSDWSVHLLPYISPSIAQQLENRGFNTIGDVAERIHTVEVGTTPEPLYPELPLLPLKAKALIQDDMIVPRTGQTYSYAIPKFVTLSLTFCAESDPANDRVFASGLSLSMGVPPKSSYCLAFDNWWRVWKKALKRINRQTDPDIDSILHDVKLELDSILFRSVPESTISNFYEAITVLKGFDIKVPGDSGKVKKFVHAWVTYNYIYINEDLELENELRLAKKLVSRLHALIQISNILELYCVVQGRKEGTYFGPKMALFYWSSHQLNNFQKMLERNMKYLIDDPLIEQKFQDIVTWFTPPESEVGNPYQHKKMYDVQLYAQTTIGFPEIINYTWHEIAKKLLKSKIETGYYWIKHFDYMDFQVWHEFVDAEDPVKKAKKKKNIRNQLYSKMVSINKLRIHFQRYSQHAISQYATPMKNLEFVQTSTEIRDLFHPIAKIWYLFAKLNGALDELEADSIRTIYPEFSIGKLKAGAVSNLHIKEHIREKKKEKIKNKYIYQFQLRGLSSNMKIGVKNLVLLIPNEKRDMMVGNWSRKWEISISEMTWNDSISGYDVISEPTKTHFNELYQGEIQNPLPHPSWFIYPVAFDAWSRKLYGNGGLLQTCRFGNSWLGDRLTHIWKLNQKYTLDSPSSWSFRAPEVYMYAPSFLPQHSESSSTLSSHLESKIDPSPDISQAQAINLALQGTIVGIKGPPGTGKSQTITALIEEFCLRRKARGITSNKILVTAFSYAALRVLMKKFRKSTLKSKDPSFVAQIQVVFLRSPWQDPFQDVPGTYPIDDLERNNGTWKLNGESRSVTKKKNLEKSLEESFIICTNAIQLYFLAKEERVLKDFAFDLIVVDEASQVPTDQFLASLQFVHNGIFKIHPLSFRDEQGSKRIKQEISILANDLSVDDSPTEEKLTKVVIVGDFNQLPPVQPVPPPKNLERVLDSLFAYYVKYHGIVSHQLKINYRSHQDIVDFTSHLKFYDELQTHKINRNAPLQGDFSHITTSWIRDLLDPSIVVSALIHDREYEIAVCSVEADIVTQIVKAFFLSRNPETPIQENIFWKESLGIVAPHNAQGRLIIQKIFHMMTKDLHTCLTHVDLMRLLRNTIYSVEKFQGSDRELIIASIGLSDIDQLKAEEEFIYDLNRFNVLTSRAKHKIILLCSEKFLDFIPHNRIIMEQAAQIRNYAYDFCNCQKSVFRVNEQNNLEYLKFRWYDRTKKEQKMSSSFQIKFFPKFPVCDFQVSQDDKYNSILKQIPKGLIKSRDHSAESIKNYEFKIKNVLKLQQFIPFSQEILQLYQKHYGKLPSGKDSTKNSGISQNKTLKLDKNLKKASYQSEEINLQVDKKNEPLY
jgi:hypothetical protein